MTSSARQAACVLIVDDEPFVRDSLGEILGGEGFRTLTASGADEAVKSLASQPVDAVVTDLRMPGGDGLALLREAGAQKIGVPIIVISGVGTVSEAVEAMKAGAFDFLQKPVDPEELVLLVRRAVEHRELVREVERLRETVRGLREPRHLVGSSAAMARVRAAIAQVAPTDATALITGESGTGKEIAAEEIHRQSRRALRSLVRLNCAAIPHELFESELFGHRKGAFTGAVEDRAGRFEEAEGGTLVLDEIGTLTPGMQAKLLRVLDTGEYQVVGDSRTRKADARVIAVTNEDLAARVDAGAFRADLLYRLDVFPIPMPPLREHKEDIPEIAEHLLRRSEVRAAPAKAGLSKEVLEVLGSYDWPGNVRELRNVIERAAIVAEAGALDAALFHRLLEPGLGSAAEGGAEGLHLRKALDVCERDLLIKALERCGGRKKDASALLGIDPRNLAYYLRKHGIGGQELAS